MNKYRILGGNYTAHEAWCKFIDVADNQYQPSELFQSIDPYGDGISENDLMEAVAELVYYTVNDTIIFTELDQCNLTEACYEYAKSFLNWVDTSEDE